MTSSNLGLGAFVAVTCCAIGVACSSSSTDAPPAPVALTTSAAVTGAPDTHCTKTVTVSQAACTAAPEEEEDAGQADGGAPVSDYGETLYNSEGDDDDCKYHVTWKSSAVGQNSDVTFAVVVVKKADNSLATNATPDVEVFLDDTHPAPNSDQKSTETSPGNYTIGPVRFDAAGKWTVRFHFFDSCNDNEESPHGHAAFFVSVP